MCGIFGYCGARKNATQVVLSGLRLLEYRGYDSWGIAVKKDSKIKTEKHVGKIGDAITSLPDSSMAIGHTRWATHGGVTEANAHPHLDCTKQIAVLHNGIIENYQEIKDELVQKGHTFISQTDTEVASHLIEENLKIAGFASAVRNAFNRFRGMNAIVVMNSTSHEIIAAKNGSPLVIGEGEDEYFLASDAAGIAEYTKKVLFLKDHEMVILGKTLQILSLPEGKELTPEFEIIDWNIEQAHQGDFPHFMLKEIYEQPTVIRNLVSSYDSQIKQLAELIQSAHGTFFIAAGTANNAALAGTYLFSKIAKRHTNSAPASEFNYLLDFITEKSLIIALSQSGETIDVVEPLTAAKDKGAMVVGIVNALGSTIYRMADFRILLGAGPEKAVASTKAYSAKIALLLLLSYTLAGNKNTIKPLMERAATEIEGMLEEKKQKSIEHLAEKLMNKEHIYVIGRGASYPSALEAALKIKEVSYISTEGLAGGELKHGTIALIEKGTPCIVFAPHDETYEAMISNATEIKARGGMIIGVSDNNTDVFDEWIEIEDLKEATLLTQIVPLQLLAYYLAVKKGYDPDKPRNLAKSVTVK